MFTTYKQLVIQDYVVSSRTLPTSYKGINNSRSGYRARRRPWKIRLDNTIAILNKHAYGANEATLLALQLKLQLLPLRLTAGVDT